MQTRQRVDLHSRDGVAYRFPSFPVQSSLLVVGQSKSAATSSSSGPERRYDRRRTVAENLGLPTRRLKEFDLILVVDTELKRDEMADYCERELMSPLLLVLGGSSTSGGSSVSGSPSAAWPASPRVPLTPQSGVTGQASRLKARMAVRTSEFDPLPPSVLRQYLAYARALDPPHIGREVRAMIDAAFRQYQLTQDHAASGCGADVRLLESIVRLSQARARIELSREVTREHVQDVCDLLQYVNQDEVNLREAHQDMRGSQPHTDGHQRRSSGEQHRTHTNERRERPWG